MAKVLFIDTVEECLVHSYLSIPYLALSYVWGGAKTFQLTTKNFDSLRIRGSLRRHWSEIPQTIQDAIFLARDTKFRYLWIDQLCIVQDDEENKAMHIQRMDSIYANASITIVAADGDHADHGLRSLWGGLPRSQSPQKILDFAPHGGKYAISNTYIDYEQPKKYFTRGWTYQEYNLSRRLLIFVNDKVIWKCLSCEIQEGMTKVTYERRHLFYIWEPSLKNVSQWPDFRAYLSFAEEYSPRLLTYDSDALSAFSGILDAINPYYPGGFLQGLPELYFDVALLWQPRDPLRRRRSHEGQYCPPSWSWLGWEGELDLEICEHGLEYPLTYGYSRPCVYTMNTYPLTRWFKSAGDLGSKTPIDNSYYRYYHLRVPNFDRASEALPETDFLHRVTNPATLPNGEVENDELWLDGWTLSALDYGDDKLSAIRYEGPWPSYRHKSVDGLEAASYPLPVGKPPIPLQNPDLKYLYFRSSRAYFFMGDMLERYQENRPVSCASVLLLDKQCDIAGFLRLNATEIPDRQPGRCELVAVSTGQAHIRSYTMPLILDEISNPECLNRIAEVHGGSKDFPKDSRELDTEEQYLRNFIGVYPWYNVLWIEWVDGIAYRKALGRVFKEVWEAQDLEEVNVILG